MKKDILNDVLVIIIIILSIWFLLWIAWGRWDNHEQAGLRDNWENAYFISAQEEQIEAERGIEGGAL